MFISDTVMGVWPISGGNAALKNFDIAVTTIMDAVRERRDAGG